MTGPGQAGGQRATGSSPEPTNTGTLPRPVAPVNQSVAWLDGLRAGARVTVRLPWTEALFHAGLVTSVRQRTRSRHGRTICTRTIAVEAGRLAPVFGGDGYERGGKGQIFPPAALAAHRRALREAAAGGHT